ncbi:MAG: hypothetical protein BWY72_00179 [Bacteroidetes bacterium ADurb.Bin416]|nr:MAG: hypothetical protein BWY72_00179 [Bacteroidetes bacterium ADurb.Bin416]
METYSTRGERKPDRSMLYTLKKSTKTTSKYVT